MALKPDIELEQTASKGRYFIRQERSDDAELTFSKAGTKLMIIDHTEVPDSFRGEGIGLALVTRAVEDARANGVKVIPLCPFAASQFRRLAEWSDVLK